MKRSRIMAVTYARKVVEFETRDELSVARRTVVFATEHGVTEDDGATFFSRHLMAEPLIESIGDKSKNTRRRNILGR